MLYLQMEAKLAEYRARKRREIVINKTKEKISSLIPKFNFNMGIQHHESDENELIPSTSKEKISTSLDVPSEDDLEDEAIEELEPESWKMYIIKGILYFVLWATVYAIFIELQFGVIYLIVSGLIGVYFNTRTRPRKRGEKSAYSVFNKNCERIEGTLTGEQLEKAMVYGALHVI